MQLFQLAKEQLKFMARSLPDVKARVAEQKLELPLSQVDFPLLKMEVFADDDPAFDEKKSQVPDMRLPFHKKKDQEADYEAMQEGVNEFVISALLVAFNQTQPQLPMDDMPSVRLAQDQGDGSLYLRFIRPDLETFGVSAAAQTLDRMEELMFKGWKKVPGAIHKELRKKFMNDEQCDLAGHLLHCMGRAAGYSDIEIESKFETSPDDHTLTVRKEFLAHLAEVEQTSEADFGRVKH